MNNQVFIYDTTLRDGTQMEGISLSLQDKLSIAQRLDDFGVHYIEGGWPGSNPKDAEFFDAVREMEFKNAKIAAFGSTRRRGMAVEDDPNMQTLVAAGTPVVTLYGKSWDLHVRDVIRADPEENLDMIKDSCAFMKANGKEVVYDAEHFFDGYKANPEYALLTLQAAVSGGADVLVLCDTNGGSLPWEIAEIMRTVADTFDVAVGIHTHNDGGCGVANSLAAIDAGAVHVQGTINGYGERVGNANLCSIIPDAQLKMGRSLVDEQSLSALKDLAHYVAEIANLPHDTHAPFVGDSAFSHKGGTHVAAMRRNPESYQHILPELVGNVQRSVVSELSGRGNILDKAAEYGIDVDNEAAVNVLMQIKQLESEGFAFEAAEASMTLLIQRMNPDYTPPFKLLDFNSWINVRNDVGMSSTATVHIEIDGEDVLTAAQGNGPVNALSMALRKALFTRYPHLEAIHLADYKVRILDGENGTEARTRVLIDFIDQSSDQRWTTVGASTNIIKASWLALADSYEFALLNGN